VKTPAQATGHPGDWITDWPVQGPTDEGIRAADCWWAQNVLPAVPHCVDCQCPGHVLVPGWSRRTMACPGSGMIGEAVSYGGVGVLGFALGALAELAPGKVYTLTVFTTKGQDGTKLAQSIFASGQLMSAGAVARLDKSDVPIGGGVTGDQWLLPAMTKSALKLPFTLPNMPWQVTSAVEAQAAQPPPSQAFFSSLSADQQKWVLDALVKLNAFIEQTSKTKCETFAPNITAATGCFQLWFNANFTGQGKPVRAIRQDSVFDEDTLCALQMITLRELADFPVQFPDPGKQHCLPPCPSGQVRDAKTGQCAEASGFSTGAMIGIGAAGVAAVGGIIYAVTRGGGKRRRSRRR
jgi:hypothetical protein